MIKTTFWFFILLVGIGLSCRCAEAHLLILESSDQHSAYDQIPRFVREVYWQRQQFLEKYPKGKVVLLINGDFSGLSEFAIDEGNFNYEMLTRLAHDFELVVTVGNHEGFDWEGVDGNRLFLAQNSKLVREVSRIQGKPFYLTNANLLRGEAGKNIIRPYRDIPLGESGKSVRFVGLALRDFFKRSNYAGGKEPYVFTGAVWNPVETSLVELRNARQDNIGTVILASHDGYANLARDLDVIKQRMKEDAFDWPKIPIAFAAHDHLRFLGQVQDTHLADAGHSYNFNSVVLDNNGEVIETGFTPGQQHVLMPPSFRNRNEEWIFHEARRIVKEARALYDRVLGQIPKEIGETRRTLQSGRCQLGDALADAMVEWAKGVLAVKRPGHNYTVLGFYNSSSYRSEAPIPAGNITGATIWRAYPFKTKPRIALVRGSDVPKLFKSLREYRLQTEANPQRQYTPQLSSNLIEVGEKNLMYRNGVGAVPLNPTQVYAIAMDGWLAHNKYEVEEWDELKSKVEWLDDGDMLQTEVLARHLPKKLMELESASETCASRTAQGDSL